MLKPKIKCEYASLSPEEWKPLPEGFGSGGGR